MGRPIIYHCWPPPASCRSALCLYLAPFKAGPSPDIKTKDVIQIDDIRIENIRDTEFILTQNTIGDWATFLIREDGQLKTLKAQIIAFYGTVPFPLI